jgi:hypothetical protein
MRTFAVVCLLFLLTSCANLEAGIAEKLAGFVKDGTITPEQFEQIMAVVREAKAAGSDWLGRLGQSAIDILLALVGVRVWRGSTTDRKGLPVPTPPAP